MFRKKKYEQKRWRADNVVIRTDDGYLDLQHNKEKNVLEFHCDDLTSTHFENIKELINTLKTDKQTVYLEWVQHNGSYYYFDLAKVIETTQNRISLDINILNVSPQTIHTNTDEIKSNDDENDHDIIMLDESCYFDESIAIETKLSPNDILIISPLKSMNIGYTDMGTYNKHKLFLGRRPTQDFIINNKIQYIMNCCFRANDEDITKLCIERNFNVATWQWKVKKKKYIFTPLISTTTDDKNDKNDKNEKDDKDEKAEELQKEKEVKMNGKEYLDAMINEINEYISSGNVLIHCLAGAHRSPFITGCYLCKYGGFQNKTPKEIYTFMKNRRNVVEELGFDDDLKKYQDFLKK